MHSFSVSRQLAVYPSIFAPLPVGGQISIVDSEFFFMISIFCTSRFFGHIAPAIQFPRTPGVIVLSRLKTGVSDGDCQTSLKNGPSAPKLPLTFQVATPSTISSNLIGVL